MQAYVKRDVDLKKLVGMGFTQNNKGYRTHIEGATYLVVNPVTREVYFTGPFGDHNRDIAREKDKGTLKKMDEAGLIYYTGAWRNGKNNVIKS